MWRLSVPLRALEDDRHQSTRRLLQSFVTLSALLALLQACVLRLCLALLCGGGRAARAASAMHESSLFLLDDASDLLHVDLSRTPPEAEPGAPRPLAGHAAARDDLLDNGDWTGGGRHPQRSRALSALKLT